MAINFSAEMNCHRRQSTFAVSRTVGLFKDTTQKQPNKLQEKRKFYQADLVPPNLGSSYILMSAVATWRECSTALSFVTCLSTRNAIAENFSAEMKCRRRRCTFADTPSVFSKTPAPNAKQTAVKRKIVPSRSGSPN